MNTDKLFLSCDGALYDARNLARTIRPLYARHVRDITNTVEMRASIRAGKYAFPGGYECFFIADDGACICHDCARKEYRLISASINSKSRDGWRIVALDCACNVDDFLMCAHCSRVIVEACEDIADDSN